MSQKLFVILLWEQKRHFLEALLEARRVYKPRSEPEKVFVVLLWEQKLQFLWAWWLARRVYKQRSEPERRRLTKFLPVGATAVCIGS